MLFNYFLKIWKLSGFLKQQPHHDYELLIKVDSIGIFCGCHILLTFTLGWVVVFLLVCLMNNYFHTVSQQMLSTTINAPDLHEIEQRCVLKFTMFDI